MSIRTPRAVTGLLLPILAALAFAGSASAAPSAAGWSIHVVPGPTIFGSGDSTGNDAYQLFVTNLGAAPTIGTFTVTDTVPAGLTPDPGGVQQSEGFEACSTAGQTVICTGGGEPLAPGEFATVDIPVDVASGAESPLTDAASVSGGGAPDAVSTTAPTTIGGPALPFGLQSGSAGEQMTVIDADGSPALGAGSHPNALQTNFAFNTVDETTEGLVALYPRGHARDVTASLPQGLIVNPDATLVKCTDAELETDTGEGISEPGCPAASRIGVVSLTLQITGEGQSTRQDQKSGGPYTRPLYNMVPPPGIPSDFGFDAGGSGIYEHIMGSVRTGGDYGLSAGTSDITAQYQITGLTVTLFGKAPGSPTPLLTMPSACSPSLTSSGTADSWENPGVFSTVSSTVPDQHGNPLPVTGCDREDFTPSINVQPNNAAADSPSGLDVDLKVPQETSDGPTAEANLKAASVTLPAGMAVNPSSANGLAACSEYQIELSGPNPPTCPAASKLGTAEIDTPLVDHPLPGAIYLAQPEQNPFDSLLALYLVVDDQQSGVIIKSPGEVKADPVTGRLTANFEENPELPFEELKVSLFGGSLASLTTPQTCGTYTTFSDLTPWSTPEGTDAFSSSTFRISTGAGGGACASSESQLPNRPSFEVGTTNPIGGAYSPLLLKVSREDGSQRLSKIETTLPEGLLGRLAGIPYCPEADIAQAEQRSGPDEGALEQAHPSCPAASQVGIVVVGAGAGPDPVYVSGRAYLAGPYKGAPLSLVIVTPAIAGPFDLGTVVVRTALRVDPLTARITAVSDPLPQIVQGIPLDIRSVAVKADRPDFTLNPTSCDPMAITGSLASVNGQAAAVSEPFQVGDCRNLGFKPSLKLSLSGQTHRAGHPGLKAVLTMPGGDADIARAQVNLPHSEFVDQANFDKTCTRPVLLEGRCPAKSIYGHLKAWSPLLEAPLEGPVYVVGGFGYKLPALVAELNGQIRLLLVGKIDSGKNHGIRATFEAVPDAPVSRVVLQMKGGRKYSLLENSEDLCREPQRAIANFTAQNGAVDQWKPLIANDCGKGGSKAKKHGGHAGAGKGGH